MKTLLTIFTLVFTVMFSSTSFAGWTMVDINVKGTFYVDFDRIRKHDGFVYYWTLTDRIKPNEQGLLSYKVYYQGDCKLFREKGLSASFHKEPMGRGTGLTSNKENPDWHYPTPNSMGETVLKSVCAYAK